MNDLSITDILNVYFSRRPDWCRNQFAPRHMDGIVLFTEGEIEYHFEKKNLIARKGDLLFLPGNLPYSGQRHSDSVAFYVLDFRSSSPNALEMLLGPAVYTPENAPLLESRFSQAVSFWNQQPLHVHTSIKALAYSLLSEVLSAAPATKTVAPTDAIIAYILENLSAPALSVSQLCKEFFISESQLRRNLFKATHLNPNEYIQALRINRAKNELLSSGRSVQDISLSCGFASPYYFSRCFRESTGLSPSEYRKKYSEI